jgi:hypothetical protein
VTKKIADMIRGDAYIHIPVFFQSFQLLSVDFFLFFFSNFGARKLSCVSCNGFLFVSQKI